MIACIVAVAGCCDALSVAIARPWAQAQRELTRPAVHADVFTASRNMERGA